MSRSQAPARGCFGEREGLSEKFKKTLSGISTVDHILINFRRSSLKTLLRMFLRQVEMMTVTF